MMANKIKTRVLFLQSALPRAFAVSIFAADRPRPSFSFSAQVLCLNIGKFARFEETLRACLPNQLSFWFAKAGYPRTSALLACAEAHVTFPAPPFAVGKGLVLRVVEPLCVVNPGVAHPPPRCGDGDRDKDMVPSPGVPGTAGSGWVNRFDGKLS